MAVSPVHYFDFHTHLDFYDEKEITSVVQNIVKEKIRTFAASVNVESFHRNLEIKEMVIKEALESGYSKEEAEKLVTVTFGVHPSYCKTLPVKENEAFELLNPFYEKSEMISEVGLDFFWEKECPKEIQIMHLLIALQNANEKSKVVILHTKGAEKEILSILKDFPKARPVIHWYDGPDDIYKAFIEKGYPETFGCEIKYSESIRAFLRITPSELIFPETDNPTGEPWLGGTDSSPLLIKRVYEDIAQVKGWTIEETSEILGRNLQRLI